MRAIGLMSGTSLDGVDAALIETDGETVDRFGPTLYRSYTPSERDILRAALDAGTRIVRRDDRSGVLGEAEALIDAAHAEITLDLVKSAGLKAEAVDVIGFHGQTVVHRPARRLTVQIGDGAALARATGIAVVHDMRAADVAVGGNGAPLVPVYHRALARGSELPLPAAVVNIGGVANVTWIGPDGDLVAFDTGPGNALLNDLMTARTGSDFDRDGEAARGGTTDMAALDVLLADDFFLRLPPKSLDRNHFHGFALDAVKHLPVGDAAKTLSDFTAAGIAAAARHMPVPPKVWIVAGGGARNPAIVESLRQRMDAPVRTAGEVGWDVDALEAQAFAFLAVRHLKGLPITFPSTTGAPAPMTGGLLARPGGPARQAASG